MLKLEKGPLQSFRNQVFKFSIALFSILTAISCSSHKTGPSQRPRPFFLQQQDTTHHFSGLVVLDPISNDTLINHNGGKYFIPASTVKIFTLYMALKALPDKIPALKYVQTGDTLYIEGTGDPTFLHPDFKDSPTLDFLKSRPNLVLGRNNYFGERYGPGWAWEDFDTYFSPEIGSLPLYGNVVTIIQNDSLHVVPNYFKPNITFKDTTKFREEYTNTFYVPTDTDTDTLKVPFLTSNDITSTLLQKALGHHKITTVDRIPQLNKKTFFGIWSDSVYRKMLHESDNFLAEQLTLTVSSSLSDSLSFAKAKEHLLSNYLNGLPQKPRWVDASGLSRYNLFTPESMVYVLHKLFREFDQEQLWHLFPYWNKNGSFSKLDKGAPPPFIIAKSGSMGNVYNLSGYLITKSGKTLIFSFMNNHFQKPSSEIKASIEQLLTELHQQN